MRWTTLSGCEFDRCPVNNSRLALFPGVGLTSLGRLIFRSALSLSWSERFVEALLTETATTTTPLGEYVQWRGGWQSVCAGDGGKRPRP